MLDLTPEGRGTDWYPKLEYRRAERPRRYRKTAVHAN